MSKAEYPTKHPNLGWAKAMVKRRQRARCIQAAVYIYMRYIYIYIHALLSFLYVFWIPISCHSRSNTIKTINIILHTIHSICTTIHKHTHGAVYIYMHWSAHWTSCWVPHLRCSDPFWALSSSFVSGTAPSTFTLDAANIDASEWQMDMFCNTTTPKNLMKIAPNRIQKIFKNMPSEKEGIWFKGPLKTKPITVQLIFPPSGLFSLLGFWECQSFAIWVALRLDLPDVGLPG